MRKVETQTQPLIAIALLGVQGLRENFFLAALFVS